MADIEGFVEECRKAADEPQTVLAVKEVVERAILDGVEGLSDKTGIRVLFVDDCLTILHVVIPGGLPKSLPHNHTMWAVIGMAEGQESNEFFRRSASSLEASGGHLVETGQAVALGSEVIHRICNPLTHSASSALHVYGGDLLATSRSMWTKPGWKEEPFDEARATGAAFVRQ